jgi:hypothetical protein
MSDPRDDRSPLRAHLDRLARDVQPPRDLWPDVARGIEQAQRRARWTRGAAAAGVLAAAAVLVLVLGTRGHAPQTDFAAGGAGSGAAGSGAASGAGSGVAGSTSGALVAAVSSPAPAPAAAPPAPPLPGETDYQGAERLLAAELDARRAALSPGQTAALDDGLRVVDEAIDSTRAAVREHPDDPELRAELDRVWEGKLDLLRQATELTSEL